MGTRGFEPLTSAMSMRRANQLRQVPLWPVASGDRANQLRQAPLVRPAGFEPATYRI